MLWINTGKPNIINSEKDMTHMVYPDDGDDDWCFMATFVHKVG